MDDGGGRLIRDSRRDGTREWGAVDAADVLAGEGCVGVVVPEETAERPGLAGVVGGGRGPVDVSEMVDQGRGCSGER